MCVGCQHNRLGSFGKSRNPISSEIVAGNIPLDESETLPGLLMSSWPEFSLNWLPMLGPWLASHITLPDPVVLKALLLTPFFSDRLKPFHSFIWFLFLLPLSQCNESPNPVDTSFPKASLILSFYLLLLPEFGFLLSYSLQIPCFFFQFHPFLICPK